MYFEDSEEEEEEEELSIDEESNFAPTSAVAAREMRNVGFVNSSHTTDRAHTKALLGRCTFPPPLILALRGTVTRALRQKIGATPTVPPNRVSTEGRRRPAVHWTYLVRMLPLLTLKMLLSQLPTEPTLKLVSRRCRRAVICGVRQEGCCCSPRPLTVPRAPAVFQLFLSMQLLLCRVCLLNTI